MGSVFKWLFSISLLLNSVYANALLFTKTPPPSLDSVKEQLASFPQDDIQRLPLLAELVKQTWRTAPNEAERYGEQALALHEMHDAPNEKASMIAYLTRVYLDRRDSATAQALIDQGIAAAKRSDDSKLLPLNLFNQAMLHTFNNKMILSLNSYRELEAHYREVGNLGNVGNILNNIANIQRNLGDLDGAFATYTEALPLIKEHSQQIYYANTLMNLGEVFYHLEEYQQAESNYLKGQALLSEDKAPLPYFESLLRLGTLARKTNRFEEAVEYYQRAEKIGIKYQFNGPLVAAYYGMIRLAVRLGDLKLMEDSLNKAERIVDANLGKSLGSYIFYFRGLVASKFGDWAEAEKNIDKLFEKQVFDSRHYAMQDALTLALKVKKQLGKTDEAVDIVMASVERYQDFQEKNRQNMLAQYSELYKTSEKEVEISALKSQQIAQQNQLLLEQQRNRTMIFIFVILTLCLLTLASLALQRSRLAKREHAMSMALMQEKKDFFANVSHELRTPLTVFKLKMQELQYNIAEDPQAVYSMLHDRIESFNHLINDISLLATNDKGELEVKFEPVPARAFFHRCADELEIMAKSHELEVVVDIQVPREQIAAFDPARLRQIQTNLFSNACRYTDSPGLIRFHVKTQKKHLVIEIEDTAPTLSRDQLARVFERLYRADKSRSRRLGGSGLGLSICKDLVEAHGGNIDARASKLGGVKIEVEIPLNEGKLDE